MKQIEIEDLIQKIQAVWAKEIKFDYSLASLVMKIYPSYGCDESVSDKVFKLVFKNCLYFKGSNILPTSNKGQVEFIAWGAKPINCCRNKTCRIYGKLKKESTLNISHLFPKNDYTHYFFQNVFGNMIDVLAKTVEVEEMGTSN